MSEGKFFKMSDGEGSDKQRPRQSQAELQHLKAQFMERARSFMDDTALGDGKQAFKKLMGKVKGEAVTDEALTEEDEVLESHAEDANASDEAWEGEVYEEDFEDDEYEYEDDPREELDWSRPEYIHAGYAKPGTSFETQRTLEDAQEESMDLKFGNLSGLLSRFGSEDAVPEDEAETATREMDKSVFRAHMQKVYGALQATSGIRDPQLLLHPEVLTLFRGHNTDLKVLHFVMAALFARTEENYLLKADQAWIKTLMERAGYLMKSEGLERQLEQTFLFPERVHRLYESLIEEPIALSQEHVLTYEQNLAKLYIHEMATRYAADPRTVIRTLAQQWQQWAAELQAAEQAVAPALEQYERFQNRKMTSASLFEKLRRAEQAVESHFLKLQALAVDIEDLKAVTRFLEEAEALAKLEQFPTAAFLPEGFVEQDMGLKELREAFVALQLKNTPAPASAQPVEPAEAKDLILSPVEQKHAIARAKAGEWKSLKKVFLYKCSRLDALVPQL